MHTMKQECKFGFIEYREPNLEEGLRLMTSFSSDKVGLEGLIHGLDDLLALVTKVELKIGKKKISSVEEIKNISKLEIMTMIANMRVHIQTIMYDLEDEKKS